MGNLPKAVVCDLDSTVADTRHRWDLARFALNGPAELAVARWERYSLACRFDRPIWPVVNVLRQYQRDHSIQFLSSRDVAAGEKTWSWLNRHGIPVDGIWLRDKLPFAEHKKTIIKSIMAKWDVELVIDDNNDSCEGYRELGLNVLQVKPPYRPEDDLWPTYAV